MATLVTGVPGWLGTRLVEMLCKEGREVRCLVLRGANTSSLTPFKVEICEGNLKDKSSLKKAVKGIATIFHCAGIIHPRLFRAKDFYNINTNGTKNLLEEAILAEVKKFIYVSSNAAQGYNVNCLMTENGPCKPETDYGKSKCQAELTVDFFREKYGLRTIIIRPCPFYGPGQPPRHTRIMQMVKKGRAPVFGDGKTLRSLTYITNLVDGLLLAESHMNIANGKVYWIADDKHYTWMEYLEGIAEALGVKLKVKRYPRWVAQACGVADKFLGSLGMYAITPHVAWETTKDIAVSIEKAKRELGYQSKVELKEGMVKTVEWCKKNNLL